MLRAVSSKRMRTKMREWWRVVCWEKQRLVSQGPCSESERARQVSAVRQPRPVVEKGGLSLPSRCAATESHSVMIAEKQDQPWLLTTMRTRHCTGCSVRKLKPSLRATSTLPCWSAIEAPSCGYGLQRLSVIRDVTWHQVIRLMRSSKPDSRSDQVPRNALVAPLQRANPRPTEHHPSTTQQRAAVAHILTKACVHMELALYRKQYPRAADDTRVVVGCAPRGGAVCWKQSMAQ